MKHGGSEGAALPGPGGLGGRDKLQDAMAKAGFPAHTYHPLSSSLYLGVQVSWLAGEAVPAYMGVILTEWQTVHAALG